MSVGVDATSWRYDGILRASIARRTVIVVALMCILGFPLTIAYISWSRCLELLPDVSILSRRSAFDVDSVSSGCLDVNVEVVRLTLTLSCLIHIQVPKAFLGACRLRCPNHWELATSSVSLAWLANVRGLDPFWMSGSSDRPYSDRGAQNPKFRSLFFYIWS